MRIPIFFFFPTSGRAVHFVDRGDATRIQSFHDLGGLANNRFGGMGLYEDPFAFFSIEGHAFRLFIVSATKEPRRWMFTVDHPRKVDLVGGAIVLRHINRRDSDVTNHAVCVDPRFQYDTISGLDRYNFAGDWGWYGDWGDLSRDVSFFV